MLIENDIVLSLLKINMKALIISVKILVPKLISDVSKLKKRNIG